MPVLPRLLARRNGFTLVELLIVVAIIGVLSTIGIPTFRRLIQKSKKTEAKVNLGGLYTAANKRLLPNMVGMATLLPRMGFQVDGNVLDLTYAIGFYDNGCVPRVTILLQRILPSSANASGASIAAAYPSYYAAVGAGSIITQYQRMAR